MFLSCSSHPMPRRSHGAGTRRVGEWGHPLGYERRGRHPGGVESEGVLRLYAVPPPSRVRRGALAPSSLPLHSAPPPSLGPLPGGPALLALGGRVVRWRSAGGGGSPFSFGSCLGELAKPGLGGRALGGGTSACPPLRCRGDRGGVGCRCPGPRRMGTGVLDLNLRTPPRGVLVYGFA